MRLSCKALRRLSKLVHPGLYGICAAILSSFAFQPLHAADYSDRSEAYVLSENKTDDSRARVFSKDKPLFGSQSGIPSVTPDRSGRTKVQVIVKPSAPSTDSAASERTSQSKLPEGTLRSPYASRAKVEQELRQSERRTSGSANPVATQLDVVRDQSPSTSTKSIEHKRAEDVFRRAMKQGARREYKPSRAQAPVVLLPTAKPGARSAYRSEPATINAAKNTKNRAKPKFDVVKKSRQRARKQPDARRANYRRARHERRRLQRRRARRVARWRRNAPPGTVNSFVRCWPGEPCVRYYRVRRPRTLRQYRRLMAWQRRQDARLRYRRHYSRY